MKVIRSLLLINAALITVGGQALAQSTSDNTAEGDSKGRLARCLAVADEGYRRQWAKHCPGGYMINSKCDLPRYIAEPLNNRLAQSRDMCFQFKDAGS